MPTMSVIVPVYNVERYLAACLDSILSQTYSDLEVICVNDGSPDRSAEILELYAQLDERVRVISIENHGVSHARNVGMEAARGTYLCFVDSDDLLMPEACETVVRAFEENGDDVVKFSAVAFPPQNSNYWIDSTLCVGEGLFEGYSSPLIFEEHSRPFPWNGAYRTSFVRDRGLRFPEGLSLGEDQVFSFATLCRSRMTQLIPEQLYRYRLSRKDSLTAIASGDMVQKLATHQEVVRAIMDDWHSAGLMQGESASRMLDFVCIFLLFDIFELEDETGRDQLLSSLSALLRDQMGRDDLLRWASGPGVRDILLRVYDYDGDSVPFGKRGVYELTRAIYGRKAVLRRRVRDLRSALLPERKRPRVAEADEDVEDVDDGEDVDVVLARLRRRISDASESAASYDAKEL